MWDARRFDGTKSIVLAQVGIMGPRNMFVSFALLVVGCFCGVAIFLIAFYRPRKLGDHAYLSWVKKNQ